MPGLSCIAARAGNPLCQRARAFGSSRRGPRRMCRDSARRPGEDHAAMVTAADRHLAAELLKDRDLTYAARAGITLADRPAPLYQLMVLVTLLSKPIGADLAVAGTRELMSAGWRTPQRMKTATWPDRVDALGRGHYRR